MDELYQINAQPEIYSLFRKSLDDLKKGKGKIFCISGETGFGKSYVLSSFNKDISLNQSGFESVLVEGQSPIGNFNVGNIQPLLPFSRAVEKLLKKGKGEDSAGKNFTKNIGLTVLASLPFVGTVFYAVKELGRDWREYKKDKSSSSIKNVSSAAADYFDALCSFADKIPLILLFDDFHWCDAQSLELLNLFVEKIASLPIIIVITYRKSLIISKGLILLSFIQRFKKSYDNVHILELNGFNPEHLNLCCKNYFRNYKTSKEFEDWLYNQSLGVPGVIFEYLKYFKNNSPFLSDGKLIENFEHSNFLPTSIHSAFSQVLDKLDDEERNILSICSCEGREFTAIIISQLLNTDILSSIKKLRSLQNKTGIMRSIGSQIRYGVRTTAYEFTQAFYHTFFENSLEYEEHVALHGQIAALLKQKYDDAESEAIRQEIAPYLAAHSAEAGDTQTAKSMLLLAAQAAQKFGSTEVIKDLYDNFQNIGKSEKDDEQENADKIDNEDLVFNEMLKTSLHITKETSEENKDNITYENNEQILTEDFNIIRKTVVEYYLKKNYSMAVDFAIQYLNGSNNELRLNEKIQLLSIAVKSLIELNDFSRAEKYCIDAKALLKDKDDPLSECIFLNTLSALQVSQGKDAEAMQNLQLAAEKSMILPPELRLLTLSNIAIIMESTDSVQANKYFDAVR
ncbi:MAG: AAA family ATPase, partial [FCB group bacterium]